MPRETIGPRAAQANLRKALALVAEVARHPEAYPDDFVALPLALVPKVLTPERTRLLERLAEHGSYPSVNDLAAALRRDQSRVSRDLLILAGAGLVKLERRGKAKRVRAAGRVVMVV